MSDEIKTPFDAAIERLNQIKQMLNNKTLIEGEDFGRIPGTGGKPTLLKPGAQKLMAAFNLASVVREVSRDSVVEKVWDKDKTIISYRVIVALQSKLTGMPEGEGVGACNSGEKRYAKQSAQDVDNTVLKMARKRAMVDAVLDATGAGSLFTQDIEDMDFSGNHDAPQAAPRPQNLNNGHQHQNGNGHAPQAEEPVLTRNQTRGPKLSAMQELMRDCEVAGICLDSEGRAVAPHIANALKAENFSAVITGENRAKAFAVLQEREGRKGQIPAQMADAGRGMEAQPADDDGYDPVAEANALFEAQGAHGYPAN